MSSVHTEITESSAAVRSPVTSCRLASASGEEYLATHGLQPDVLTLGSNGAIRQAARVGLGVALLSRMAVELELRHGLLAAIHVRGGLPKRSWYVVRSAVGPTPESVDQFIAFVRSDGGRRALAPS